MRPVNALQVRSTDPHSPPPLPTEPDAFDPEWLTIKECAERARVSIKTVRRAIDQRRLRAHQLVDRGHWHIRFEDYQAWMRGIDPRQSR